MMRDGTAFRIAPYNGGSRPWVKIPERVDYREYAEIKAKEHEDVNGRQSGNQFDEIALPGLPRKDRGMPRQVRGIQSVPGRTG